jgi:pantetheine-phosphate adenylyltransferase
VGNIRLRAIYPGSFDPVTNGHLDILGRAAKTFSEVVVAVLHNASKSALFTVDERLEMLREETKQWPNVSVGSFTGLTVDYARKVQATHMVRGLRAVSDFDAEFRIGLTNRKLADDVESVFFLTNLEYQFLSSSGVKEIASFGGPVKGMVPDAVAARLAEKFATRHTTVEE